MARTVLVTSSGSLTHQLEMPGSAASLASATEGTAPATWNAAAPPAGADGPQVPSTVVLANNIGGFAPDGSEYVLAVGGDGQTPAPWSNVLANPTFGCLVTEAGPRCTWVDNSQSRRLTAWANDPVTDPATEAVFLHDRATDRAWSLTPSPRPVGRALPRSACAGPHDVGARHRRVAQRAVGIGAGGCAGQTGAPASAQRLAKHADGHADAGTPS